MPPRSRNVAQPGAGGEVLRGLPPVIARHVRVLVLGSFPSVASLAAGQYYAHPRNLFWRIVGQSVGEPLHELAYEARLSTVLAAGIAIWDVYAACERTGSLDAAIRNGVANDFRGLKHKTPNLMRVCFNGQSAGRFAPALAACGYETAILPSTSPANASWSYARKRAAWHDGLSPALGTGRQLAGK